MAPLSEPSPNLRSKRQCWHGSGCCLLEHQSGKRPEPQNRDLRLQSRSFSGATLRTSGASHTALGNLGPSRDRISFAAQLALRAALKFCLNTHGRTAFRQMNVILFLFFRNLSFFEGARRPIFLASLPLNEIFWERLSGLDASHHRLPPDEDGHLNDRLGWGWGWTTPILSYLTLFEPGKIKGCAVTSSKIAKVLILSLFLGMYELCLRIVLDPGNRFSSAPFPQKNAMEALDYRIGVINCGQLGAASLRCNISSLAEDLLSTMFGPRP